MWGVDLPPMEGGLDAPASVSHEDSIKRSRSYTQAYHSVTLLASSVRASNLPLKWQAQITIPKKILLYFRLSAVKSHLKIAKNIATVNIGFLADY